MIYSEVANRGSRQILLTIIPPLQYIHATLQIEFLESPVPRSVVIWSYLAHGVRGVRGWGGDTEQEVEKHNFF